MKTPENIDKETEQLAPTLFKIKKENPFEVPVGYFDTLPHVIQDICIQQTKQKQANPWYYFLLKPQLSVSLVVLAVAIISGSHFYKQQQLQKAPEDITQVYLSEIDENTMIENIVDNDKRLEDNKIDQYLIDNQVDVNDL